MYVANINKIKIKKTDEIKKMVFFLRQASTEFVAIYVRSDNNEKREESAGETE